MRKVITPREFARVDQADLERMAALLPPADPADPAGGKGTADAAAVAALRRQVTDLRAALAKAENRPA